MNTRSIILWSALCLSMTLQAQEIIREDSIAEVVVTGTGTPHLLKNAPVQTEVISGKMLRNYAGRSIEDILSGLSASFSFNEDDMGSHLQLNGLGNNYILILINGKRIHGDVGGENDLSLIDPQNIERIEIVKGASSALYGSDAIAGVINIITKKHDEGLLAENTTRIGSYGEIRQHNGFGVKLGKFNSWTSFRLQHSDGWQNTSMEDPKQTEFPIYDSRNKTVNRNTAWQIGERLTYNPTDNMEFYAEGSFHRKRIYRPSGKYPSTDVKTFDMLYRNYSAAVGGKYSLNKTDFLSLDIDWNRHAYYYHFTATTLTDGKIDGKLTHYFPYFAGQQQLQSDQQRTMTALKGVFSLPYDNRFSAGLEWRYDWLNAPMRVVNEKATDHTIALYAQDEFAWLQPLFVTVGLRLNNNQQFGWKLTPKVSAMLSLGAFRLRSTWSQGFKTPSPKELHYKYVREMNGAYLFLGNTSLRPQTSNYYSLSGEYTYSGLSITVTGYYNKLKDMITLVTIPKTQTPGEYIILYDPVKVRQYKNLESAETYGVDVTARYSVKEFAFGLGYSYLDTKGNLYDANHDRLHEVVIDGMAHHKGNVFAIWNHSFGENYKLGVGLYGRMSSKRYYQINGNGKGYHTWRISSTHDLGSSKKFSYRVEAGIDNIFNYVDRTPHGLHLGTTTPGTTIYASFSIRFNQGKKVKNNHNYQLNNKYNDEEND